MGLSLDLDEACSSMNLPLSSHVGLGESLDDPRAPSGSWDDDSHSCFTGLLEKGQA